MSKNAGLIFNAKEFLEMTFWKQLDVEKTKERGRGVEKLHLRVEELCRDRKLLHQ
jgi:hypothetical protein